MKTFAEYYELLLKWEKEPQRKLIYMWRKNLINEVAKDFEQSIKRSKVLGLSCDLREGKESQADGNDVDNFVVEKLNEKLRVFKIYKCPEKGYPDRILAKGSIKQIALEMKSTGSWNSKDTQRRVLTSSSKKLRVNFTDPIYHLICNVTYKKLKQKAEILTIRLDFINPRSFVNIRLEASSTHKIFDKGNHEKREFTK